MAGKLMRIIVVDAGLLEIRLPTTSGHIDVRLERIVLNHEIVPGRVGEHDGVIYHTEEFPYDTASRIASGELELVK